MSPKHLIAFTVALGVAFPPVMNALQNQSKPSPKPAAHTSNNQAKTVHDSQDEGQRIFEQNCSRCHAAPEGFSPRISGTIVRHMRVRASLSQHEEQELLQFFNP
jgi:cytochrome c5